MKNIVYFIVLSLFISLTTVAQKNSSDSSLTFIERYYKIRDSFKDLPDAYGPYASSNYSVDEFMKRYNAFKDSYPSLSKYSGVFAGGKNSLTDFERKYY